MRKSILVLLLLGVAGIGATSHNWGGWATVTVDDLPDYFVAGQPVRLSFVVRQHGMRPLDGLRPVVEATSGNANLSIDAMPAVSELTGRYVATLTVPRAGAWTVRIRSGFGNSEATLMPIQAVAAGAAAPALSDAERGRRLFLAKGCFSCHVNREVTTAHSLSIGPDLTGRRYPPEPLAKFLARPDSMRLTQVASANAFMMPRLGLKDREIASLVAMINSGPDVSAR